MNTQMKTKVKIVRQSMNENADEFEKKINEFLANEKITSQSHVMKPILHITADRVGWLTVSIEYLSKNK